MGGKSAELAVLGQAVIQVMLTSPPHEASVGVEPIAEPREAV